MFDCQKDEKTFWRTMNPARLHALFNAYSEYHRPQRAAAPSPAPQDEERSLSAFLMGGD